MRPIPRFQDSDVHSDVHLGKRERVEEMTHERSPGSQKDIAMVWISDTPQRAHVFQVGLLEDVSSRGH